MASLASLALPAAASAAQVTGSTQSLVIQPLTLVNSRALSFGNIIATATQGTVTIDAFTQARTMTGGAIPAGGTISAAEFTGLTLSPSHLKIDVPNGSILIQNGSGATMIVDNFELNGDKNNWEAANSVFTFQVGARLRVAANQAPGTYTGEFEVTVNYR